MMHFLYFLKFAINTLLLTYTVATIKTRFPQKIILLSLLMLTHLHLVPRSQNEWSYITTPPVRLHGVVLS